VKRRRIGFLDEDEAPSVSLGSISQLTEAKDPPEKEEEPSDPVVFEARVTALSRGGSYLVHGLESHTGASIGERIDWLIGRYGYDGDLRSLTVVIEIPTLDALRASLEAIQRKIAEAT
jgi:hypothetical protein